MAEGSGMPPYLSAKRSTQSGTKAMTLAWQVLYAESCSQAYMFMSGLIDLTNMQAGDTIQVRVEKVLVSGGAWVVADVMTYNDVQPANHMTCPIGGASDVYGIRVSARQTAGVLRNLDCEFYDAKRLGFV